MKKDQHFIIDFDSTFTKVEALDVLCAISLKDKPEKESTLNQIKELTDKGMNGEISFKDSLKERVELLQAHRDHLPALIEALHEEVSESFKRNKEFVKKYAKNILIVSNGFKDFIDPIVAHFDIPSERVFANEFIYDEAGFIVGFDENNPLAKDRSKPQLIEQLQLEGKIFVIGDGFTDYEIKQAGMAHKFYAFTENIRREKVLNHADHEAPSLDEFLYSNNMERALSYPKNRINVLALENIHTNAFDKLKSEGYSVVYHSSAMTEDELIEAIKDVSILCIRSKTQVTKRVLEHAERLMVIGAFCIGTNQIDLDECLMNGVIVFNAPYSNTRSVVELAIAEMIFLTRQIPDKSIGMHAKKWNKSANGSREIRGKTLGIIGYGNIGSQLSVLAEGMGLDVCYFDIDDKLGLGNAKKKETMDELLACSDIISLHVDGRPENKNIIDTQQFSQMKSDVIFLNLSRGHVVDIEALTKARNDGIVRGIGVDVFPIEPKSNEYPFESKLIGQPNTILTPHIGGSTEEAQEHIADFVPNKIMNYINTGSTANSVNFPSLSLPEFKNSHRFIHIHKNKPGILAKIDQVLANHNINIIGQYLKTSEKVGYVITDIDKAYEANVKKDLKLINGTLRFRVLY
ncbi:MAG: phosphoglycerate dehydrogenase [Cytophagales bacterium]|nr:phosphoglycerate dehydrogenase [Cytophagales bacterium]